MKVLIQLVIASIMSMVLSTAQAQSISSNAELINQYKTVIRIEHDSRHLYHLQSKALLAHIGGWARPANEDGSELDSLSGVPTQVIQLDLNRLKDRIRRNKFEEGFANELSEIIAMFEGAMTTSLEIAKHLEAGQVAEANRIYKDRSMLRYEELWRSTYSLFRDIERQL